MPRFKFMSNFMRVTYNKWNLLKLEAKIYWCRCPSLITDVSLSCSFSSDKTFHLPHTVQKRRSSGVSNTPIPTNHCPFYFLDLLNSFSSCTLIWCLNQSFPLRAKWIRVSSTCGSRVTSGSLDHAVALKKRNTFSFIKQKFLHCN